LVAEEELVRGQGTKGRRIKRRQKLFAIDELRIHDEFVDENGGGRAVTKAAFLCMNCYNSKCRRIESARMVEPELANELPQRAEQAVRHLLRLIEDPTAKARDRLKAAQILKKYLGALEHLLQSRQTTPDLHKAITDVLRKYWRS
jgi:hypothetical protein